MIKPLNKSWLLMIILIVVSQSGSAEPTGLTGTSTSTISTSTPPTTTTEVKNCTRLNTSSNVIKDSDSISLNSTVTFQCAAGYKLRGVNFTTCLASGKWSAEPPTCDEINCTRINTSSNVIKDSNSISLNSTVTFQCAEGYKLRGVNSTTCLASGDWSAEPPTCDEINCTRLSTSSNVIKDSDSVSLNSTVTFQCADGYKLRGVNSTTCLASGKWSAEPPTCDEINCTRLNTSSNVIKDSELISFNSTVHFKCADGYKLTRVNSTTCLSSGEWSAEPPTCDVIIPSRPTNGSILNVTEYTFAVAWTYKNPQSYIYYDIIIPKGATIDPYLTEGNDTIYRLSSNMTSVVIGNLNAGNEYEISIYTVAVFEGVPGYPSESALNLSTYTVPLAPQNVTLPEDGIKNNSFVVNLHDPDPAFTNWTIEVSDNKTNETVHCETYSSANTDKNVTIRDSNFTSGTSYTAYIYTSVPRYISRTKKIIPFFTRPSDPAMMNVADDSITSTGFVVNVAANDFNFDHYWLKVCHNHSDTCFNQSGANSTEQINVANLTSGTLYTCTLYTVLKNGFKSYTPKEIPVYTRPNPPKSVTNSTVHENNITINIITSDDRYGSFLVYLGGELIENSTEKMYIIPRLDPATLYNVTVYTVIGDNLTSTESKTLSFTTRPKTPGNGSVSEVNLHEIGLNFPNFTANRFDSFYIQYKEANQTRNFTVNRTQLHIEMNNLTAGTLYTFEVYTYFQGLLSDDSGWIISYTKPEQIRNLNVTVTTNTSLQLQWDPPNEGLVDNYTVSYDCIGPNDDSHNISNERTDPEQNIELSGLSPGTFCIASITTVVGDQKGYATIEALPVSTDENGPDVVEAENITSVGSRYIEIQWRRPSKRNGIINNYEISASLNGTNVQTVILNCSVCTMQNNLTDLHELQQFVNDCASASNCNNSISEDSLHYNFIELHPFRVYTFSITAFTKEKGKSETITGETSEDKPEGPPQDITVYPDKFSIKLKWEPPSYDVRNGIITNYTVQYSFTRETCYNPLNESKVEIPINDNQTETNLTNLLPFTDYHIQIKASTSVGYGNYSGITTISTKQSVPSKIDISRTNQTVTNESIKLDWETPCPANGIITNYTIQIRNVNPNDTKPDSNKTTQTNDTTVTIEGLMPYRNYTISISGNTIAGGNYSDEFNVTTNISIPKSPENISVIAISSKELEVTWNKPSLLNYTGPTHYVVVVKDKRNETAENTTYGFENNNCIVNDLEEYWSYTVNVTAITKEGSTTSASTDGQTSQDVPLEVESIEVLPQENVTLKRSIFVKWSPPTELNKNGIIINYYVGYSSISLEKSKVFGLPPTSNEYTIENISPGNYTVTVYAATSVGNGTHSNKSAELLPGAPLKVPENRTNPLMREASLQVSNKKKELAIILPTDSFLCNRTNGVPIEWGVVVAQDSEATDTPYNGDKAGFEKKKETYMAWSSVKDKDSIPPYIATPINWSPCSSSSGTRRRRSTNHQITTFTVGEDGDCSGRCNGALQPGRDYRVKSYVCTQNGCTETLYSVPISTEPDPTIPIVAGVVSALAVITMAAVVVFLLKRRQVACFSKDVENKPSHRPGNEITLDNIEPKQKNAFRPGPIKLADFPGEVEKMHRDSDLLFADAYKLLKDKSPNHPLTAAEQQCSRPKNRYTNILPFDHSRVKLRPSDDIEGSDYINANYIPGYSSRREYIATQGPMIATFDDFWRMVWEQNVDTIVMLTKLMEKGRRKCDKYWPDIGEPVFYGDLVVSLQSESNLSDYTIKIFEIKMKEERKVVTHFSYLKWPDMGCPETPELLLDFVKAVRQYTNRDKKPSPGPIVVHCSAGVGRTGTFIAVDYLLQHIRDHDDVDIYNLVLEMRNHRLNMVQTEDQYVYIHECLKAFITTDEEEEEEDEEPLYMNTEKEDEHIYVNTAFTKD